MHPFPSSATLQFLVGEELAQIALDPFSLQFRFDSGGQITAEGRVEHIDRSGAVHPFDCQKRLGSAIFLHQLLQHRIDRVEAEPNCLSLEFDDGAVLRIFSELGAYESGQIYPSNTGSGPIVF